MMPTKSQGSSRHKGKEIASNDPATRDVGEEVAHSESNHFDEEEARCDPDSECAPLIDLWYDTHTHFPKVPGEEEARRRAMCGLPFTVVTQIYLGLRWLL